MGTETKPGKFNCLDKAEKDEPRFVLLARDPNAAPLVERWADMRQELLDYGHREDTPAEREQIAEAREIAETMRKYHGDRRARLEASAA